MKLKVFGGLTMERGKQLRTIVATTSKAKAAEILGFTLYSFNEMFSETGNKTELEVALKKPNTLFKATDSMGYDFSEYKDV